jgi:hypothetical protein
MTTALLCDNCGKPMSQHGPLANCWPAKPTAKQWLEDRADHYDAEARMLRDVGEPRMGLIFEIIRDELRKCVGEMEA